MPLVAFNGNENTLYVSIVKGLVFLELTNVVVGRGLKRFLTQVYKSEATVPAPCTAMIQTLNSQTTPHNINDILFLQTYS